MSCKAKEEVSHDDYMQVFYKNKPCENQKLHT